MTNRKAEDAPIHVDEWVDDCSRKQPVGEKYARWFLFLARLAAVYRMDWQDWFKHHKLFCTYEGARYRCTGASRMGDIWLAKDYTRETGYDLRVDLAKCSEWSDNLGIPSWEAAALFSGDDAAALNKIQELRKTPDMMVTVRAEDLACLMWKAHDTTKALTDFLDKTEFVQEEFNKKPEERDDCFPKLSDVWGLHRGDILRQWIDNLNRSLRNAI